MVYPIILRVLHIGTGFFWAGAAVFTAFFLEPASRGMGPDGGKFLGALLNKSRFTALMTVAAILTTLSGVLLYGRNTAWFSAMSWASTGTGLTFSVGALFGIAAFIIGGALTGPLSNKMSEISGQLAEAQGPPDEETLGLMAIVRERLRTASMTSGILLIIAVLAMSVAQYVR